MPRPRLCCGRPEQSWASRRRIWPAAPETTCSKTARSAGRPWPAGSGGPHPVRRARRRDRHRQRRRSFHRGRALGVPSGRGARPGSVHGGLVGLRKNRPGDGLSRFPRARSGLRSDAHGAGPVAGGRRPFGGGVSPPGGRRKLGRQTTGSVVVKTPADLTALEAVARLEADSLTAESLVRSGLERISEREPAIEAWQYLDPEQALAAARALDAGPRRGPLRSCWTRG